MPRWLLWTPVMAFTVAMAVLGLRAGWHVSALTESDVINRAAQDYVEGGQGRQMIDCVAMPASQRKIWLIVTCTATNGSIETYHATRFGKVRLGTGSNQRPET